ncbi:MAG: putative transcriptional regulator, family [Betaproteobacteria bacterium]|nr:putative transcriptional regulator, family [Betaproteobacteria bacterium]
MQELVSSLPSPIDYAALGDRLRAYRMGASLLAEDVAARLGVSRAAVYRMEKGEIIKIETLERLAPLLGTSVASLLGVEVEYYSTALGFLERMRQLEQDSERILAHFEPISLLLTSGEYLDHLRIMLVEAASSSASPEAGPGEHQVDEMLRVLHERKAAFARRAPHIVSLIGLRDLERFVYTGLVGRLDLPQAVRRERVAAARREVERIAELMESESLQVQIGLVDDAMPAATFQVFGGSRRSTLAVSPFRFGELPNVRNGIATVTASPEAVKLYEEMIARLWKGAYKGQAGAARLREMLARMQ